MTSDKRHLSARAAMVGSLLVASMCVSTRGAVAQTVLRACFVPNTGVVYRIAAPGAPDSCRSTRHVEFSWTDADGADHGALAGLSDDDHPQYVKPAAPPSDGEMLAWDATSTAWVPVAPGGGGAGVTDHGALTGLGDDDHAQYLLLDGVRDAADGFAVTDASGGGSIPFEGSGRRFMWYPGKNAFRVGSAGAHWDDANIGGSSVAMGASTTASGGASFAMGFLTTASERRAVAFGEGSTASGPQSTALGLFTTASGQASTAMGSSTTASGASSTALGQQTVASGAWSTAMGRRASTNSHSGSFVYGDNSINATLLAPGANSFTVRAAGGTTFYSSGDLSNGVTLAAGAGAWAAVSDRNRKENFRSEDGEAALARIAAMPIQSWNYKTQDPSVRHMGPTAQDFHAAFGLGDSELTITTTDLGGVSLLAIQALERRTAELRAENEELSRRIADLEALLRSSARSSSTSTEHRTPNW